VFSGEKNVRQIWLVGKTLFSIAHGNEGHPLEEGVKRQNLCL